MACNSHIRGQNRVLDYLYDSSHVVPSLKDVQRINSNAAQKYAPIKILTKYDVMFANIPMANRRIICPKYELFPQIGVKKSINTTPFTNKDMFLNNKCDEKYLQFFPSSNPSRDIKGAFRSTIFYHNTNSSKQTTAVELYQKCIEMQQITPQPKEKNVGIQTLYRESSAQTSPYFPDAIVTDTTTKEPEIIQIANILKGTEQPGNFEVKVIERLRKKRQWEKYFSKVSSVEEINKRQQIFEAFQWEEWLSREQQINEIQNIRFEMVKQMMEKREKSMEKNFELRLNKSIERIANEYEKDIEKLDRKYNRDLRKIDRKYKISKEIRRTKGKQNLSSIDDKSKPNNKKRNFVFANKLSYEHLEEFSKKLQEDKFIECPVTKIDRLARPKRSIKEIYQGFSSEKNLKKFHESLQMLNKNLTEKIDKNKSKTTKSCLNKIKKDTTRRDINNQLMKLISSPPSQKIKDNKVLEILDVHNTVLASDKLVSNIIYEKEEQADIIIENIDRPESTLKIEEGEKKEEHEMSAALNFLDSELKRLKDERKVQALYMLAEQKRIKRETNESEIRQKEVKMRRKCDETYRNLMKASQDTVTTFLENVLIEETQIKANNDAKEEIQKLAKMIDLQVHQEILKSETGLTLSCDHDQTVVSDVIDNFLFPEVEKRMERKTAENENYRYIYAADIALNSEIEHMFDTKESSIVETLAEQILSSQGLLPNNAGNNELYYEANEVVKDILRIVFAHPDIRVFNATDEHASRTISNQNLLHERIEKIISKVSVNLKKHQAEDDTESSSDISSSILEEEKSKLGTSVVTIPAIINLLEFKKKSIAKKIAKFVIQREQSFDKEEAVERTTLVQHYALHKQHENEKSFSASSSFSTTLDDSFAIQKEKNNEIIRDNDSESILIESEVITEFHKENNNLEQNAEQNPAEN